jgi:hypothetical protein
LNGLNDLGISDLTPVVPGRPRTKAGRLSLRGTLGGAKVKIFEAHSATHAHFIKNFMQDGKLAKFFPQVYAIHEKLVVCTWAEGKTAEQKRLSLRKSNAQKTARFLEAAQAFFKTLHTCVPPANPGFDYMEDFIRPRFEACCRALNSPELETLRKSACKSLDRLGGQGNRVYCSHADLTPPNAVFTPNGSMAIIDNELLGTTRVPFMDELNLLQGLPGWAIKRHAPLLRPLIKTTLGHMGRETEEDMFNVWMMRRIGSWYITGQNRRIRKFLSMDALMQRERLPFWKIVRILAS